jgi:prepilin-type processing-associated H-X9-DG protein
MLTTLDTSYFDRGHSLIISMTTSAAAFSRLDLIVVLSIVTCLGAIGATAIAMSQHARMAQCASNLKQLGAATSLYSKDNDDRLPFAYIQYTEWESVAWDGLIFSFDKGKSEISSSSLDEKDNLLKCPSDPVETRSRTYAMPEHDMSAHNWPPGPENNTGIGLWWSCWAQGIASLRNVDPVIEQLPALRLTTIPTPAITLLLAEHANHENVMFDYHGATISGPDEHLDTQTSRMTRYHNGKFNYLMLDGHVEQLFPTQKVEMWTIRHSD